MAKQSKQSAQSNPSSEGTFWFDKLTPFKKDAVCVLILYGLVLLLFGKIVFGSMSLSSSPDTLAAMGWEKAVTHIAQTETNEPLWVPYIFSGMPVFGALMFPRNVNFLETIVQIPGRLMFFNCDNFWFIFHYFLMGLFTYMLARRLQFSHLPSLLAAVTVMLNPYSFGLAQGGHGSKLVTLSYIPLAFLLTHDLMKKRDLLTFGLLGATFGTMFLARHPQIAFYGLLFTGGYVVYNVILNIKQEALKGGIKILLFALAVGIGFAIYTYEFLPTQEYANYSIRGGSETGVSKGLDYDYATNWSFHPLETLTYVIPSFFGFSTEYELEIEGQKQPFASYWGWMPFTDGPVYAGIIPLILGIIGLIYKRDRLSWYLTIFFLFSLSLSFGKHMGLVYNLFFNYFPYFNKFRVPVLILHLAPLPIGLLAAYGAEFLLGLKSQAKSIDLAKMKNRMMVIAGALAGLLLIGIVAKSGMESFLSGFMFNSPNDPQLLRQYGEQAIKVFREGRFLVFWNYFMWCTILSGVMVTLVYAYLNNRIQRSIMVVGFIVLVVVDLSLMDQKFMKPQTISAVQEELQPDATVQKIKAESETELFRVFPVGDYDGHNLMMYHLIQSVDGYSPAKLKIYQDVRDSCFPRGNRNVINMLNVKYFVGTQKGRDGVTQTVTEPNPGGLPRVWFVDSTTVAHSNAEVFAILNAPSWNPKQTAVLEKQLPVKISRDDSAAVSVTKYESREITLQAKTHATALLVLSEIYYPGGWKAFVDGKETEIYKTNYILRSVVIPPGTHTITFTFNPVSYQLGYTLSESAWGLSGLIILLGLFRHPWVREKILKKKADAQPAAGTSQ